MAINSSDAQNARGGGIRNRFRAVTLGIGAAVILVLAAFGAVTIVGDFVSGADTASAAGVDAMHAAGSNGGSSGTQAMMTARQPDMDEMVRLCTEHMQSMSSMMQMMGDRGQSGR